MVDAPPLMPFDEPVSSEGAPSGILVVDDHDLVRLGLRALVQAQASPGGGAPAVFEARTITEALAVYAGNAHAIGVVLLDLALPDTQGLSGLAEFRKRFPLARTVVLSGTANPALAQGALALGASAFLPKSGHLGEVMHYIQRRGLLDPPTRDAAVEAPSAMAVRQLTQRQLQVMDWVLAGKSNREIAQLAHLSEGTVKNHVSTILLVFGLRSRAQLISSLR